MNHDEAATFLPELLRGGLHDSVRSDLAAHLAACGECRALAVTYDVLTEALGRDGADVLGRDGGAVATGHLPAREIVADAVERDALPAPELERIATHLNSCRSCEKEVEMTRGAHDETRRGSILPFAPARLAALRVPAARAAMAAAAAVLVLLGYPAWLGLARLPRAARDASDLRAANEAVGREAADLRSSLDRSTADLRAVTSWNGAVTLNVLEAPVRGGGGTKVLTIASRQPFLLVAVQPAIPVAAGPKDTVRFAIGREGEEPLWSDELTVAQLRDAVRLSGVVTFAVPADRVPPGSYRMTATPLGGRPGRAILDIPFEVALTN